MQAIPFLHRSERASSNEVRWDDLSRDVYCVLGLPIDALEMSDLLRAVEEAVDRNEPFLISTPNLHFLVNSQSDALFRESLLISDLCPVDGMPIVWIASLLGLPIKQRVAGSDLFEKLKKRTSDRPLKVYLFGGAAGAAEAAAKALNEAQCRIICEGSMNPGYGTIEEMSREAVLDEINTSGADFLLVALGAEKAQLWLLRNHERLRVPIRCNLGATINFTAGSVKRAPSPLRKLGLEWLWRIKEEPHLWRRYGYDGVFLLRLLLTRVVPLAIVTRWQKAVERREPKLIIDWIREHNTITLKLCGAASAPNVQNAAAIFKEALCIAQDIRINLAHTYVIDARFLGLLFMVRKLARKQGSVLQFVGISSRLRTMFNLHGAGFLLRSAESE